MSRRAGWRRSSKPLEISEPDLDQRSNGRFEPRVPRDRKRLLVALPRFRGIDALLEAVVTGHQQLLDPRAGFRLLHSRSLAAHISV
jgi:hypothetical protein